MPDSHRGAARRARLSPVERQSAAAAEPSDRALQGEPLQSEARRARASVANAATAILLHAEAIRRRVTHVERDMDEVLASLEHVAANAHRLWAEFEALQADASPEV